jgi:hypothetical protein
MCGSAENGGEKCGRAHASPVRLREQRAGLRSRSGHAPNRCCLDAMWTSSPADGAYRAAGTSTDTPARSTLALNGVTPTGSPSTSVMTAGSDSTVTWRAWR